MKATLKKLLRRTGKVMTQDVNENLSAIKTDASIQIEQCILYERWSANKNKVAIEDIWNAGFSNFSQFEEDGIFLYIFSKIGMGNRLCVDVGCSDGINSNTGNLLVNWGWYGVLIDGDKDSINTGIKYYNKHKNTRYYPPKFKHAFVGMENINELVKDEFITDDIDLLSIDIDGNDYWVWKALNVIRPKVVVVETHIEFGLEPIVVPYDPNFTYPSPKHEEYCGASITAFASLAKEKGYRLIGSNRYGFNTIYMRNDIGTDIFPEVPPAALLAHPRNRDRGKLFDEIKHLEYVRV